MRVSILLFLILCTLSLHAQTLTQTIRGTVTDKDSRVTLPGVNIVVLNTDPLLGAGTDMDGNFRITGVPVGFQTLKVSFVGYEEQMLPNVLVGAGKEVVLNIELLESVRKMEEVVVTAGKRENEPINELSIVSTQTFSVEQTKRYAGGFDDPSRMALSFAGVTGGNNDEQNEIIIRGNSPRGLLWQLEGVEIPTPNHFADNGSSDGAVSILSSYMLGNSDFSTGAFAPEYGNALSGVFDIYLRNGNNEQHEYAVQLSLLGVDAAAEGPFVKGKKASYLFNYRYSTLSILDKMGLRVVSGGVPVFQDLSFKIHLPTKKAGTFNVFAIGGNSTILETEEGYITDTTSGKLWQMDSGSGLGVLGINHSKIVNDKFYINSAISWATQYIYNYRDELDESDVMTPFRHEDLWNHSAKAQVTFNNKFSARHSLKSGLIYTLINYNLAGSYLDTSINTTVPLLDAIGSTHVLQGFVTWRYRINEYLKLIAGVHGMYFAQNGQVAVEPRVSIAYDLPKKQSLSFGFGLHSRREAMSIYLARERMPNGSYMQHNGSLGFSRSLHYVLSYSALVRPHLNLKVELYYQQHFDVPVSANPTSTFSLLNLADGIVSEQLTNNGKGRNYGVELTMEKYFHQNYFLLITGSLYNALYTATDKVERSSRYNNNYVANLLGGKEFVIGKHDNNSLGTSLRAIIGGGRRYTPVDLVASAAAGHEVFNPADVYTKATPVYYRIDLSLYYRWNKKRASTTFKLDVQNLTDHHNIVDYTYSPQQNKVLTRTTGQLTPVAGVKVEF
jgi:hypothetical protein